MGLTAGTRLGPYEVVSAIGAGGMGEVYRARDTKLNRDVALKILPPAFAADPDRLARFHREAQVLASVNHPHIGAIYGFEESGETHALVLEFVDGPTLADRIAQGRIPVDEALPIAMQIAEALEAAHEQGIIHRDLKPANIKLRPDGTVKVLDFGLAKLNDPNVPNGPNDSNALSMSPTITSPALMTGVGVLLGTVAYMAPEQARGKAVDKRADIWAFGCVLFEMLTGTRAFAGDERTDVIAAVLSKQPNWATLPVAVSPAVRDVLERCLEKEQRNRLRDIGDARILFDRAGREMDASPPTRRPRMGRMVMTAAVMTVAALAGVAGWWLHAPVDASARPVRFTFAFGPMRQFAAPTLTIAISPDGGRIAYPSDGRLYIRSVNQFSGAPVANSEGGDTPFFSPDGQWLGFYAGRALQRVSVAGGAPITIANVAPVLGAAWGPDDTIIFGGGVGAGLERVPASGGEPRSLTTPDSAKGEVNHGLPHFLPGGTHVLFTIGTGQGSRIAELSLPTGTWREILRPGGDAYYVAPGHLVFSDTGNIRVVPFDAKTAAVTGAIAPAIDGVVWQNTAGLEGAWFAVSERGDLVYVTGSLPEVFTKPVWVERSGREQQTIDVPSATYLGPEISPDGKRIAFSRIGTNGVGQVWILDLDRVRLTPIPSQGADYNAIWAPDRPGTLTYTSNGDLFETRVATADPPVRLMTRDQYQFPTSWSADGRTLAFMDIKPTRIETWTMVRGQPPTRLFESTANVGNPVFSPRGGALAYVSDETGQYEVYVVPVPSTGRGLQISKDGGREPVWSSSGKEVFYRNGDRMMAVKIDTEPALRSSLPVELWRRRYWSQEFLSPNYDVAPDGRFLMLQITNERVDAPRSVNVVLNWFDELKRLVPAR